VRSTVSKDLSIPGDITSFDLILLYDFKLGAMSQSGDGDGKPRTTAVKEAAMMKRVCLQIMAAAICTL
jgi:hypothetical protein